MSVVDSGIVNVDIADIRPSPENDRIYGVVDRTDLEFINLAIDIRDNGVREPLVVSLDDWIISGHRRYAAAQHVELDTVPIRFINEYRSNYDETGWLRLLRAYNHQRVKPNSVRVKETMLDIDPDLAHKRLIESREERDRETDPKLAIRGKKTRSKIGPNLQEFLRASIAVVMSVQEFWPVTVRLIHYLLLNDPPMQNTSTGKQRSQYRNDSKSYTALTNLLTRARLFGHIPWDAITDETRPTSGTCFTKDIAQFIDLENYRYLRGYRRDLLQSQPDHVELVIEKLTLQGIVQPIANKFCLPMTIGRGYCSIEPRYEIVQRFKRSGKDRLKLIVCADFDPDGDEIAHSFARSIRDDFGIEDFVAVKGMLRRDQIAKWNLPPNFESAKKTSSNYTTFVSRYKSETVWELEAIPPTVLQQSLTESIESAIDLDLFNQELERERQDSVELQAIKESFRDWCLDSF